MDGAERTYSMTEIREERRVAALLLALQQRRLDALAKIDEGTAELEQADREIEALARGEAEPKQPAVATPPDEDPRTIGERLKKILMDRTGIWLEPRDTLAEMDKHGWVDTDPDKAIQRVRHSLRRLADSNPSIERDNSGATYRYRWRRDIDGHAPVAVSSANGMAYPALPGGRTDG
jgi:hypothetical protein